MSDRILLDTHVWLWIAEGSPLISGKAKTRIVQAAEEYALYVSAYSVFEIAYAAQRGRLDLKMSLDDWFNLALVEPTVNVVPLTSQIAAASATLPPSFHGDPGDRIIIAATAIHLDLTLCTHDHAILRIGKQGAYKYLEI